MARGGHLTPNLCQTSKNASECARPHALQRGAVRVRQAPRSAARRMLPQGAAASEPSLRNPRNTRASGRATSWRSRPVAPLATPARSPDDAGTSGAGGGVACSPCSVSSSVGMLRSESSGSSSVGMLRSESRSTPRQEVRRGAGGSVERSSHTPPFRCGMGCCSSTGLFDGAPGSESSSVGMLRSRASSGGLASPPEQGGVYQHSLIDASTPSPCLGGGACEVCEGRVEGR